MWSCEFNALKGGPINEANLILSITSLGRTHKKWDTLVEEHNIHTQFAQATTKTADAIKVLWWAGKGIDRSCIERYKPETAWSD